MVAKSVVQIDVQDEAFRDFFSLFQEYQQQIEKGADVWEGTTGAIGDAGDAMEALLDLSDKNADAAMIAAYQANVIVKELRHASAANAALLESVLKGSKAQKGFADETERGNKAFASMKKNADGVAKSVFGIGKYLLKLGALGGGIIGLGGLLGGLGLKDLAESAVNNQRSARGLGMSTGQLTAFNQDFGRYIDQGTLGSIANAQNSFSGRVWLARASGLNMDQASSEDPGKLAGQLAIRAHDWWQNTPEKMRTAENLQSTGFAQSGFSLAMMRQYGNTPLSELQRAATQYGQDQNRFNVGDKQTDAWYGFLRELKDAGNTLKTNLTDKLSELAPSITNFVTSLGKDAEILINGVLTPDNLKKAGDAIQDFAKYIGSDQFRGDVKSFVGAVKDIAASAADLAHFINHVLHPFGGNPTPEDDQKSAQRTADTTGAAVDIGATSNASAANARNAKFAAAVNSTVGSASGGVWDAVKNYLTDNGNYGHRNFDQTYFDKAESSNGLPSGLLLAQMMTESHGDPNAESPKGAKGLFQFMDPTAKQFGVTNAFDAAQSTRAAGQYDAQLLKRYGGDVRKALAAYNWGMGNVDKDIKANGANWDQHLPRETQNYINKILGRMAQQRSAVTVTVNNNTAARVAVQANAASVQ